MRVEILKANRSGYVEIKYDGMKLWNAIARKTPKLNPQYKEENNDTIRALIFNPDLSGCGALHVGVAWRNKAVFVKIVYELDKGKMCITQLRVDLVESELDAFLIF